MKHKKVDLATAELMVAELYPSLDLADSVPDVAFDPIDADSIGLVYHPPVPEGRPVPIDEDRSPAGSLFAQAERLAAKREGDRYRQMSKGTSMHTVDL